jgi:competence protein ComEC
MARPRSVGWLAVALALVVGGALIVVAWSAGRDAIPPAPVSVGGGDGRAVGAADAAAARAVDGGRPHSRPGSPPRSPSTSPSAPPSTAPSAPASSSAPPTAGARMRVHLIDVGQGAATLVEFSCAAVLIDTGGEAGPGFDSTARLIAYLDGFFARRLDLHRTLAALVITHPHIDHARGALEVWRRYRVRNVVSDGLTSSSGGRQERALMAAADAAGAGDARINAHGIPAAGLRDEVIDPVACADGDPDLRVLWGAVELADVGWSQRAFKNVNNESVVVKITLGAASLLVTGDLEEAGLAALLKKYAGTATLRADVLEVGHHGSSNATSRALLAAVAPRIALIAVGAASREATWTAWEYGHPRASTIGLLEEALRGPARPAIDRPVASGPRRFAVRRIAAPIYATGWDGDVTVTMAADGGLDVATGS